MPRFSRQSLGRLGTCHPLLRDLFQRVVIISDCTILEGVRSDARQRELFRRGQSRIDGVRRRSQH